MICFLSLQTYFGKCFGNVELTSVDQPRHSPWNIVADITHDIQTHPEDCDTNGSWTLIPSAYVKQPEMSRTKGGRQ